MLPAERQEQLARSTIHTVKQTIENGGAKATKMALDTLHSFLDKTRFWNPAIDDTFFLLVKLACDTDNVQYIKSAIAAQRNRVAPLNVSHMRDSVLCCLRHGQELIDRAVGKMDANKKADAVEEAIFRAMTGMTHEERGKQCFLDPAFHQYMDIVKPCLQAIERSSKFEQLYQEVIRTALGVCQKHDRTFEMGLLNAMQRSHVRDIFTSDREMQRDTVVASSETLSSIIQTKQEQTRIARETRDWRGAVDVMRDVRDLTTRLRRLDRTLKVADLCPVWELEAEVLFAAGNMPFHAFHAVMVAKRRIFELGVSDEATSRLMASQAVLAVLCVPDKQLSTSDESSDRLIQLSKTLSMVAPPTRDGLLTDLERQAQTATGGMASLLSFAHPFVTELYNLLVSVPSIEVCKVAGPLLKKVSEQSQSLSRYIPSLEAVAVRSMLGIMSRCFCAVGIDDFISRCGGILKSDGSDFAARVEPLLRESFGRQVRIVVDFGTREIFFLPSAVAADNLIGFQGQLAAHVAEVTRSCYDVSKLQKPAAASSASSSADSKKKAAAATKALLSKIEDSRIRTLARHVVCKQRIDNFQARLSHLHEEELKRRREELLLREEKETDRVQVRKQKAEEEISKTIEKEEAQERRKWVTTQINSRHKTCNLPATLADKPDVEFLATASQQLLATMRMTEMTRTSDVRTMEYYERACREAEVPLRKEYFQALGEEQAKTRALQAENRRKQHRRAFDEALAMKQKLGRLMAHKTAYERDLQKTFADKQRKATAKRDTEEDDLMKMMAEREAAAAAAKKG